MKTGNKQYLALFTLQYPYGNGEPFLTDEVYYLAKRFDRIFIFPSSKSEKLRTTPANVEVIDDLCAEKSGRDQVIKILWQKPLRVLEVFLYELKHNPKRKQYLKFWKSMLDYLTQDLRKYDQLKSWITANKLENVTYYDYWSINSSISLGLLKKENIIRIIVLRTHGFDLYDDRHPEGIVPFRMFKTKWADAVHCISQHGKDYLLSILPSKLHPKVKLSYLGVKGNAKDIKTLRDTNAYCVVSCANMLAFKNIHRIPELIATIQDRPITWVHFGDGPMMEEIKEKASGLPENVTVELRGSVENQDILDYYLSHYVDLFIALSDSEGLPVSIMEAVMHGIPVLAFGINGVPEIVNEKTGFLLDKHTDWEQIKERFRVYLEETANFDRLKISSFAQNQFDSDKNHATFVESLALAEAQES